MIKYRQLCFWIAAVAATTSAGFAQTPPEQPAAVVDAPAVSKTVMPATPAAASDSAQPAPNSRVTATSKKTSTTQNAKSTTDPAKPARRIAIIELSPDTEKSEVIRQVVEILEKQGVAKQSTRGTTSTTSSGGIEARIAARGDTKTDDVISLVKSLQGHGVVRMSFSKPSDNRNVVTVLAPADTPWPVIDNIRIMVTAKKQFAVDVQIADPAQSARPASHNRYYFSGKPGTKEATVAPRYGYSAGGTVAAQQQRTNGANVNFVGKNGQPASRVEPTSSAVQSVLKKSAGIVVKMGDQNRLVSGVRKTNEAEVVAAILALTTAHKNVLLWADDYGLIVQTPPDSVVAQQVTQKILNSLSSRRGENSTTVAESYSDDNGSRNSSLRQTVRPVQYSEIFRLQFADASVIAQGVSQLFGKDFGIVADVRTNSVLVRGDESQLKEMEALVEMVDTPQPKRPVAQAFRPANPDDPLRQVVKPLNSLFASVDPPIATPAPTRAQIEQLDRSARAAAETLRTLKAEEAANESEVPEDEDKRKAVLRDAVRQTFLARQNLQRKELAEFAARLNRIQQSIEMRDRIADKIIDRRVEELLDPNLKWDHNEAGGTQKTVVVNETVIQRQNGGTRLQPAPKQNAQTGSNRAVGNQTVVVSQTSEGTVILRNAEEFRKLLATHAQRVAEVQATIEAWQARREDSRNAAEADQVLKIQKEALTKAEANQKFARKEYETQIRLLQSEVETVHLVLETARQELERASKLVKAAALPSHELEKRKREAIAAEQRLEKAKVLLDLYQDAAKGI